MLIMHSPNWHKTMVYQTTSGSNISNNSPENEDRSVVLKSCIHMFRQKRKVTKSYLSKLFCENMQLFCENILAKMHLHQKKHMFVTSDLWIFSHYTWKWKENFMVCTLLFMEYTYILCRTRMVGWILAMDHYFYHWSYYLDFGR